MRPALRINLPAVEYFQMESPTANEYLVKNASDLVRRINLLRKIKSNQDFLRALNGCLLIYYFTYHTIPEYFEMQGIEDDVVEIGDTLIRDNVADFADRVRRRCSQVYHIPVNSLIGWDTFYQAEPGEENDDGAVD